MEKIMAILTEEAAFARELAAFLSSKEEFLHRPVAFSDVQAYLRFERENSVDLLLCDRGMEPEEQPGTPRKVCILSEYSTVGEDEGGRSSIFKYQSSERLMQDILSCLGTEDKVGQVPKRPKLSDPAECLSFAVPAAEPVCRFRLIGVCSPIGGSRCSTLSLALADYLAKKGATLFVTLDPFFSVNGSKEPGARDLSELIYLSETHGAEDAPELADYVRTDGGAAYIKGPSHWLDLENMGRDALCRLARLIEKAGYECAVFDLGRPQTAATELLRICTDIYVTKGKTKHDEAVIAEWKRQLKASGLTDVADRMTERTVPTDRIFADGVPERGMLLEGSLGGFVKEVVDFGYFG